MRNPVEVPPYFQINTTKPDRINEPPMAKRQVSGSFRIQMLSRMVTTMLALSIVYTRATLPSFIARKEAAFRDG